MGDCAALSILWHFKWNTGASVHFGIHWGPGIPNENCNVLTHIYKYTYRHIYEGNENDTDNHQNVNMENTGKEYRSPL
jgi:hypothetical protein